MKIKRKQLFKLTIIVLNICLIFQTHFVTYLYAQEENLTNGEISVTPTQDPPAEEETIEDVNEKDEDVSPTSTEESSSSDSLTPTESPTATPTEERADQESISPTPTTISDEEVTSTTTPTVSPEPTVSLETNEQSNTASPTPEPAINEELVLSQESSTPSATITPTETQSSPTPTPEVDETKVNGEIIETESEAGETIIQTGDATAYANIVNFINQTLMESEISVFVVNNLDGGSGEIDLNEVWKEMNNSQAENLDNEQMGSLLSMESNQALLSNAVIVIAETGTNLAEGAAGDVLIITGDAEALANILNLVNINAVGSNFLIPVVNLMDDYEGNLILPAPENFSIGEEEENNTPLETIILQDNTATASSQIQSDALTGDNSTQNIGGSSEITTGDATSNIYVLNLANIDVLGTNWFHLVINNLGSFDGQILNWTNPGSIQDLPDDNIIVFDISSDTLNSFEKDDSDATQVAIIEDNQAEVTNDVQVSANTGSNQIKDADGDATIKTGNSKSAANLFNMVNVNLIRSNWFWGIINIFGNWSGNIIFAYPDLDINISTDQAEKEVGNVVEYTVNYRNIGYETAENPDVTVELPKGGMYLSDTCSSQVNISGQKLTWQVGDLYKGQGGSFQVYVKFDQELFSQTAGGIFSKIIKQAYAAERALAGKATSVARIKNHSPEPDFSNNQSSVTTSFYWPEQPQPAGRGGWKVEEVNDQTVIYEGIDHRQPKLYLEIKNNVNEFVYLGDTVTFEATIKNNSDAAAYDTFIVHQLFNEQGQNLGEAGFVLGKVRPGQRINISFGMQLDNKDLLAAGNYFTNTTAYGYAFDGSEVKSNNGQTQFELRWLTTAKPVMAQTDQSPEYSQILGSQTQNYQAPINWTLIAAWPYLLLLLASYQELLKQNKKYWPED
jgi:uncharacterized repeat protein (TIGR01451 family)